MDNTFRMSADSGFYAVKWLKGRPGLPMRLLVGLHYLKHLYDVSDERVAAGFLETRTGNTSVAKNSSCMSGPATRPVW